MQFMLVLYEDTDLVATEEQRKEAERRTGEYAMGLFGDGTLQGGAQLHPAAEGKRIRTRDGQQRILLAGTRPARADQPGSPGSAGSAGSGGAAGSAGSAGELALAAAAHRVV